MHRGRALRRQSPAAFPPTHVSEHRRLPSSRFLSSVETICVQLAPPSRIAGPLGALHVIRRSHGPRPWRAAATANPAPFQS